MRAASVALLTSFILIASPVLAEPLQLFAQVPAKASSQNAAAPQQPNPNAEAFNNKLDALLTPGTGLTADEAVRKATKTSWTVEQNRQETRSQQFLRDQAKYGFIPNLTLEASYTRTRAVTSAVAGFTFTSIPNQYSLGATLTVPLSDYFLRLPQQLAAANRSLDATVLTQRNSELTAATDARVAYYEWTRAKLQQVVQEQALDQAIAQARDARAQFEAGSSTRADVLRLDSQVASRELELERARNASALAEEELRTLMHDEAQQTPYQIGEDVRADLPELENINDMATLWKEADDHRLDLKALTLQAESQRQSASAQRSGYYPSLSATGTLQEVNPLTQKTPQTQTWDYYWTVGATLSWTPTNIFGTGAGANSTEAQATKIEAQRSLARDNVHVDVLEAYQNLKVAEVALDTTARALTSSEESYRVRLALFQNGRATTVEVIDSETDLTSARQQAIDARIDLRVARARLINALGRDIDQAM